MYINCYPSDELYHHGIKGQKWGVRRFQNADGTLTSEGRSRYSGSGNSSSGGGVRGAASRATGAVKNKWNGLSDKQKKIIKGAAITAAVALAAYGGYRLSKNEAFRAGAAKVGGALKKAGGTAVGSIKNKASDISTSVSAAIDRRRYPNSISGAGPKASFADRAKGAVNAVKNYDYKGAANRAKEAVMDAPTSVKAAIDRRRYPNSISGISGADGSRLQNIRNAAAGAANSVRSGIGNAANAVGTRARNAGSNVKGAASSVYNRARNAASDVGTSVSAAIDRRRYPNSRTGTSGKKRGK